LASVVGALTGGVAGIAIGQAGSVALDPVFEPVKQDAWKRKPSKILDQDQLATLVAQALNAFSDVLDDVERNGYASDEFHSLVQLALKAPGVPEAEKLYLRAQGGYPGSITLAQLQHAYGKSAVEGQYWKALQAAAENQLLTPAQLALGAVRSTLNDQGLLVVKLDTADSNVPQYKPAALNIIHEAAAAGVNEERLRALIGSIGLPMAAIEAARAQFRGILTMGAYNQAILEGDTRPEWAPFIHEAARQIPTAHDFVEMRLRDWFTTDKEMYDATARHGMSVSDTDLLFKVTGRPIAPHRVFIGERRGGQYGVTPPDISPAFLKAQQEGVERPEWYGLDWATRFTKPGIFFVRQWVKDGHDPARAQTWLWEEGWEQTDIDAFLTAYTPAATTTPNKHVASSATTLITATRKAYVGRAATEAQARAALTTAGISAADQDKLLVLWDAQRVLEALPTPPAT
jgi:hypothetical protein